MKVTPIEEDKSAVKVNAHNNQGTNNSKTESGDNADGFIEENVPRAINYVEPKSSRPSSGIKIRKGGQTCIHKVIFLSYSFHMTFWILK